MADGVPITPGAGVTIATDDLGAPGHAQFLKLLAGDDGSSARLDKAEDTPHVSGDPGIVAFAVRTDTIAPRAADGDYHVLQLDNLGRLYVQAFLPEGAGGRTLLQAQISASSNGDNQIVSAVPAQKIKVVSYSVVCSAAVTLRWYSASGGTALSGAMPMAANGGIVDKGDPWAPIMETVAGQALVLNLSGAFAVGGRITYFSQ